MTLLTKKFFVVLLGAAISSAAIAGEFPLRAAGNTDVVILNNANVDYALRAEFIAQAKRSIDMINFDHGGDHVGMLLIEALRVAMKRGVRVRYAYDSAVSKFDADPWDDIEKLLVDVNVLRPAELIVGRPLQKIQSGLTLTDFVHEKLIIIDAGTSNEKIFIGGRGASNFALISLDAAFVLRPVDYHLPYVGTDFSSFYETFWSKVTQLYRLEPARKASVKILKKMHTLSASYRLSPEEEENFHSIRDVLTKTPVVGDNLAPYEFRPRTAQLITNDFLQRATGAGSRREWLVRRELQYGNPIEEKLANLIKHGQDLQITSYTIGFPDPVLGAIKKLLARGGHLQIFTDGRAAQNVSFGDGFVADYASANFLKLMSDSGANSSQVDLYLFDPQAKNKAGASPKKPIYVHRKSAVLDDMVIVGSDNFTLSSATKNDELVVVLDDPAMAAAMRAQSLWESSHLFVKATVDDIKKDFKKTGWFYPVTLPFIEALY